MKDGFDVKGLDQKSIIDGVTRGTDIPLKPLAEYTKSQLVRLCVLLITLIQELILSKVGINAPSNIQEWLDEMAFKAGKDSTTSSLRPSSDMYGSRHSSPKDEPDEGENNDSSGTSDQAEAEAEAALRKKQKPQQTCEIRIKTRKAAQCQRIWFRIAGACG